MAACWLGELFRDLLTEIEQVWREEKRTVRQKMAGAAGLEPVTSAVTGQRSNRLSYAPALRAGETIE